MAKKKTGKKAATKKAPSRKKAGGRKKKGQEPDPTPPEDQETFDDDLDGLDDPDAGFDPEEDGPAGASATEGAGDPAEDGEGYGFPDEDPEEGDDSDDAEEDGEDPDDSDDAEDDLDPEPEDGGPDPEDDDPDSEDSPAEPEGLNGPQDFAGDGLPGEGSGDADDSWYTQDGHWTGMKTVPQANQGTDRFWVRRGEETRVLLLEDAPFEIWEHELRIGGRRGYYYTCRASMPGGCPLCKAGNQPYYVALFSAIHLAEWKKKDGTRVKNAKVLVAAKVGMARVRNRSPASAAAFVGASGWCPARTSRRPRTSGTSGSSMAR